MSFSLKYDKKYTFICDNMFNSYSFVYQQVFINDKLYSIMKYISNQDFKRIINESINEMFSEAGAPSGFGGGKPQGLGGAKPAGLGGAKPAGLGGAKPAGLGGGKPGAAASSAASAASVQKGGMRKVNGKIILIPNVAYTYYESDFENKSNGQTNDEGEVLKIGIDYIYNQHQEPLIKIWAQKYPDIFTASRLPRHRGMDKSDNNTMELVVFSGKEDVFIKLIPDLVKDIESLNKKMVKAGRPTGGALFKLVDNPALEYDVAAFPQFETILVNRIKSAPSRDVINTIQDRVANTWMELLTKMQDPTTLDKMRKIGGVVYNTKSATLNGGSTIGNDGFSAGHQLSYRNQVEVFTQDPNATFVAQEWVWERFYNRNVIDTSKKIIISKPDARKPTDPDAFEKACIRCGYSGTREFKARRHNKELSSSQIWAVYAAYNLINSADTFFHPVVVYDYANTEVIQGMEDVFNTQAGLADNLKGVPNDTALRADQQLAAATGKQYIQGSMKNISDVEVDAIRDILKAMISASGGTLPQGLGGDAGDDIAKLGYAYGQMLLNTGMVNFSKSEMEEAFKMAFSAAIAATYGFKSDVAAQYLQNVKQNRGTDTELKSMVMLFIDNYKSLVSLINADLMKMSKKLRKAGAPVQTPNVVEESAPVAGEEFVPVQPLSDSQLLGILGISQEELNEDEYSEQEDSVTETMLKESFFNFFDKIERL